VLLTSRNCAPAVLVVSGLLAVAPVSAGSDPAAPEAAFERRSYAPGDTAWLTLWHGSARTVRIYRVGAVGGTRARRDVLAGSPVTPAVPVATSGRIRLSMGEWPSGLYVARLQGPGGTGRAPFVLRPRRLGQHRIAVVLPTNTWAAYNLRDVDRNGLGDTWYADPRVRSVDLTRPFLDGGVPPRFRGYDRGFLRWLALRRHHVDVLADEDFERVATGDRLERLYDLIVFPGHEEYVTTHAYDIVERFRELGGNLMFLSANNFFYRVERRGRLLFKLGRWRDLGRPEAALIGVQYVDWNRNRYPNLPYRIVGAHRAPWLLAGTGLRNGDRFGRYGIEIDARTSRSPRGVRLLARIHEAFGPGKSAEMTYYETRSGARVFAAGVINFGGSALWPDVALMLDNLWERMSENRGG
jgi:N,N-dimethylformamidase beta subunit-like protein